MREGAAGADVPISFAPFGRRRSTLIDEKTDRVQMECSGIVFRRITVSQEKRKDRSPTHQYTADAFRSHYMTFFSARRFTAK